MRRYGGGESGWVHRQYRRQAFVFAAGPGDLNKRNPKNLQQVVDGVAAGRLSWVVSRSFDFADAQAAYAAILDGHTRGKSALTFA